MPLRVTLAPQQLHKIQPSDLHMVYALAIYELGAHNRLAAESHTKVWACLGNVQRGTGLKHIQSDSCP